MDFIIDGLGWLALLLIQYVALFKLYHKHKAEESYPWWSYPFAAFFLLQDVVLNLTVMSAFMLEAPREWTITDRMKRYQRIDHLDRILWRYRSHFAKNLCLILNVFDKGHC